jgi:hypothetical protein
MPKSRTRRPTTLQGLWRRNLALLASYRNENTIESQGKLANVEELLNSIASFKEDREEEYREQMLADDADMSTPLPIVTLDEFLEDITLASTVDMTDDEDAHNRISSHDCAFCQRVWSSLMFSSQEWKTTYSLLGAFSPPLLNWKKSVGCSMSLLPVPREW